MTSPSRPSQTTTGRGRRLFLSALAPVLIVLYASTRLSPSQAPAKRLAVVNFVDDANEYLWGVYSMHTQLEKVGMSNVQHVAMVSQGIPPESKALLIEWLGRDGVLEFDRSVILNKLEENLRGRPGVFLKLQAFNLTQFDKIIVLDNDILIRTNLMHWFDCPAPAATSAKGRVEWNSGAMVIEPDTNLYNTLLDYLPRVQKWDPERDDGMDVWDSNTGHQGFLSAFFTSNVTSHEMYTMTLGSSILSSSLDEHPENAYLFKYRPHVFETVHFTKHKPFGNAGKKLKTLTSNPVTCAMLREWKESVTGAPRNKLPKLPNFLKACPKPEQGTS